MNTFILLSSLLLPSFVFASPVNSTKACEDLYEAACLDQNNKVKKNTEKNTQKVRDDIDAARDKAAQSMGFKSFDEGLKEQLKTAGLEVIEPRVESAWRSLKRERGYDPSIADSLKYKSTEQCLQESQTLEISLADSPAIKEEKKKKSEAFQEKYKNLSVQLYAQDIPNFLSKHLTPLCEGYKIAPQSYSPANREKLQTICGEERQLRRKAIDLFRAEGTPEYQELSEAFVRDHFHPEIQMSQLGAGGGAFATASNSTFCFAYADLMKAVARKNAADFIQKVHTSKPMVNTMIDDVFSEKRRTLANYTLMEVRSDLQELTSQIVKDPAQKATILEEYNNIELSWLEKPKDDAYKKNADGSVTLDESKALNHKTRGIFLSTDPHGIFNDPSLSYFYEQNGYYLPTTVYGKTKRKEMIVITPVHIKEFENSPYAALAFVGHELGHKIGPDMSKANNYDLNQNYKEILACYKDKKSINLQPRQEEEAIADYLSSEVLAKRLGNLPQDKRMPALMESMKLFCQYNEYNEQNHIFSCKAEHPDTSLRISGIFGASPNLRAAVGCNAESTLYKSCGMNVSLSGKTGKSSKSSQSQGGAQ